MRGRLKENYWKISSGAHSSKMNYISCNSNGEIIKYNSYINYPLDYTYAALKHYYTKSLEEYCNKTKRGEAFYKNILFNNERKITKMNRYFKINKLTIEKVNLFIKLFFLK